MNNRVGKILAFFSTLFTPILCGVATDSSTPPRLCEKFHVKYFKGFVYEKIRFLIPSLLILFTLAGCSVSEPGGGDATTPSTGNGETIIGIEDIFTLESIKFDGKETINLIQDGNKFRGTLESTDIADSGDIETKLNEYVEQKYKTTSKFEVKYIAPKTQRNRSTGQVILRSKAYLYPRNDKTEFSDELIALELETDGTGKQYLTVEFVITYKDTTWTPPIVTDKNITIDDLETIDNQSINVGASAVNLEYQTPVKVDSTDTIPNPTDDTTFENAIKGAYEAKIGTKASVTVKTKSDIGSLKVAVVTIKPESGYTFYYELESYLIAEKTLEIVVSVPYEKILIENADVEINLNNFKIGGDTVIMGTDGLSFYGKGDKLYSYAQLKAAIETAYNGKDKVNVEIENAASAIPDDVQAVAAFVYLSPKSGHEFSDTLKNLDGGEEGFDLGYDVSTDKIKGLVYIVYTPPNIITYDDVSFDNNVAINGTSYYVNYSDVGREIYLPSTETANEATIKDAIQNAYSENAKKKMNITVTTSTANEYQVVLTVKSGFTFDPDIGNEEKNYKFIVDNTGNIERYSIDIGELYFENSNSRISLNNESEYDPSTIVDDKIGTDYTETVTDVDIQNAVKYNYSQVNGVTVAFENARATTVATKIKLTIEKGYQLVEGEDNAPVAGDPRNVEFTITITKTDELKAEAIRLSGINFNLPNGDYFYAGSDGTVTQNSADFIGSVYGSSNNNGNETATAKQNFDKLTADIVKNAIYEEYKGEWNSYSQFITINKSDILITKNGNSITGTVKVTIKSGYTFDSSIDGLSGNAVTFNVNITPETP